MSKMHKEDVNMKSAIKVMFLVSALALTAILPVHRR